MIDLRTFAIDSVYHALRFEIHPAAAAGLRERAESLIAIAERAGMPIEQLIAWIHTPAPEKEWSLAEFRRYAEFWRELRDRYRGREAS